MFDFWSVTYIRTYRQSDMGFFLPTLSPLKILNMGKTCIIFTSFYLIKN
jgi:hypothetical protein